MSTPHATATAARRMAGKIASARGAALERAALASLRARGYLCDQIATPQRQVHGQMRRTAKVFGDIVGLCPDGRGLLCECKNRRGGARPRPSDFEPHQRVVLLAWARQGGQALVAWIDAAGLHLDDVRTILGEGAVLFAKGRA